MIKYLCFSGLLFVMGCELSEPVFENPLDREVASNKGIEPPALVFFPDVITTNTGSSAATSVYAMDIEDVGMAEIKISYDPNKVSVTSVAKGDLFQGGNQPLFIREDNENGLLVIYVGYLGPNGDSISGTGNVANVVFSTISAGQSQIAISSDSKILDSSANIIKLNGYGLGLIDAQ
ncbi:MAG: cohesin domain-containing protein [Candidatus Neomarinimicrobiota bacterium]|nr:cohesin domain-containing protein [Candidatus Neomarinimicrobiota bacterium]